MQGLVVTIGAIHLVPSPKMVLQLDEKRKRYPHLPETARIIEDIRLLNQQMGVPAIVSKDKSGAPKLLLFTATYSLGIYPTPRHDAYNIGHIDPLRMYDHELLSRGLLQLKATTWEQHQALGNIGPGNSDYWQTIEYGWQHLEMLKQQARQRANVAQDTLSPEYENYLNKVGTLIEVTRQLERDRNKGQTAITYRSVTSAGEERYAARDIYIFELLGRPQVNEKELLRHQESPHLFGRVFALDGKKMTLQFEGQVDRGDIPDQGHFERVQSDTVFRAQQRAVEALQAGEAKNKHLLHVLVDRSYEIYQPANASPVEELNEEQTQAFRRALTVPDMLLVLGPPGTGKTRTITEIARACGEHGQRILITSRTHKAVDNVLERLPPQLTVIRFGLDTRVSNQMRGKLIDSQAQELQQNLLHKTAKWAKPLEDFINYKDTIGQYLNHLTQQAQLLQEQEKRLAATMQQSSIQAQQITEPLRPQIDQLSSTLQRLQNSLTHNASKMQARQREQLSLTARTQQPLIGLVFTWLLHLSIYRLARTQTNQQSLQAQYTAADREYQKLQQERINRLDNDPAYQQTRQTIRQAQEEQRRLQQKARGFIRPLNQMMQGLVISATEPEQLRSDQIHHFMRWYNIQRGILERRAILLQEWRTELQSRTEQLYPELLRYADVVGATCIGVATARGLDDLAFDLAIVDEAGQISLPDLLVPLVRARRAVLVGDHQQLPPFVDSEVQTWLDGLPPQTQQALGLEEEDDDTWLDELLTRSTFENLFTAPAPSTHLVRFTKQRRTPQVIADFVSEHFYDGRLSTFGAEKLENAPHPDILFRKPLAFIDTSSLPLAQRAESNPDKKSDDPEAWGKAGYANRLEAELLAEIAAIYQRADLDWVVIVPYQAQAKLIRAHLNKKLDEHDPTTDERIATVDAFQGGERDIVLYGFTRSNSRGNIGFLKELRRLNVAMTRARQQLVLVGDSVTLERARDSQFRQLMQGLSSTVKQRGEWLSYDACQKRLQRHREIGTKE